MPVASQRTHGTTFRALKVTCQVATLGAESAVYDCLIYRRHSIDKCFRVVRPSVRAWRNSPPDLPSIF